MELVLHVKCTCSNNPTCGVTVNEGNLACLRCQNRACITLEVNRSRLHDVPDDLFAYIGLEGCCVCSVFISTAAVPLCMTAVESAYSDNFEIRLSELQCFCSPINVIIQVKYYNGRRILLYLKTAGLCSQDIEHGLSNVDINYLVVELRIGNIDIYLIRIYIYISIIKFILRIISSLIKEIRPALLNILYLVGRADSVDQTVNVCVRIRIYSLNEIFIRIISGKPDITVAQLSLCMNFRIKVFVMDFLISGT